MTPRDEPIPLRDALATVGRQLGLPATDVVAQIEARWAEVVGTAVARHARLGSVHDGVCTVVVDGPAWATQLRYGARELVERVNVCCGTTVVTAIKVVVDGARKTR